MELEWNYEIARTADFIRTRNFTRVALQFPDESLKDSTMVVRALNERLRCSEGNASDADVRLYVMADTTYGSCCVDEVGAAHINADCVVHYGHTCLSPTSTLPALYIFGKAPLSISKCADNLYNFASTSGKPVLVLFGLEYAYALEEIREALEGASVKTCGTTCKLSVLFADVICSVMEPSEIFRATNGHRATNGSLVGDHISGSTMGTRYTNAGLSWNLPAEHRVEEYSIYWIGSDNSAFANVVLTCNSCEIVRYDATKNDLVTDVSSQKRILKRRYYLVEKAKDANIVGILVGTLGVAGYLHMINQMKDLIMRAGRKSYILATGKPNPAKLANFPECDVFIYVSCAQTALLDSKEFLAPVITPYEATLAFSRGSQWTGAYLLEFKGLMISSTLEVSDQIEEARFSFLQGGYVEDFGMKDNDEEDEDGTMALVKATEKALVARDNVSRCVIKGSAKSGAEYFASRTFQGLENPSEKYLPGPVLIGRTGKASGYVDEKIQNENRL